MTLEEELMHLLLERHRRGAQVMGWVWRKIRGDVDPDLHRAMIARIQARLETEREIDLDRGCPRENCRTVSLGKAIANIRLLLPPGNEEREDLT